MSPKTRPFSRRREAPPTGGRPAPVPQPASPADDPDRMTKSGRLHLSEIKKALDQARKAQ
jgi:hypothetical protein